MIYVVISLLWFAFVVFYSSRIISKINKNTLTSDSQFPEKIWRTTEFRGNPYGLTPNSIVTSSKGTISNRFISNYIEPKIIDTQRNLRTTRVEKDVLSLENLLSAKVHNEATQKKTLLQARSSFELSATKTEEPLKNSWSKSIH